MSSQRMDQETLERLLGGRAAGSRDGADPLVRLLAALRAAARPEELRGERAALDAYRVARAAPPAPVTALDGRRTLLAGLVSGKAALAALALAATGGVALAAAHAVAPGPDGPAVGPGSSPPATGRPSASGGPSPHPAGSPAGTRVPAAPLVRLCRQLRANAPKDPGRVLAEPRYAELVAAAGAPDRVAAWCAETLDAAAGSEPTGPAGDRDRPDENGRPDGRPSRTPTLPATPAAPVPPSRPVAPTGPGLPPVG
ncbi:hypothetical protein ABGB16_06265 [Micromonospora sp. B11E3]|uniref:hypothetical protein n=1 Tax=Micromonospora sp. B11E3 TaxID=3153562 RepID=UPI00325CE841